MSYGKARCLAVLLLVLVSTVIAGGFARPAAAATFAYVTIDVPGAQWTQAAGINNAGKIVGTYKDAGGALHAFSYLGGTFTTIDVPGAVETEAHGINNLGQVVGGYQDSTGKAHGFLLSGGTFTTIDYPGASGPGAPSGTTLYGINDSGTVVGNHCPCSFGYANGFVYAAGSFTAVAYPGAAATAAGGIDNAGDVVGTYEPFDGSVHSYKLSAGSYVSFDVPGASQTEAYGVSFDGSSIVGREYAAGVWHGYLNSGGSFTTFDPPGSNVTTATGINDGGEIAGSFLNSSGIYNGFTASTAAPNVVTNTGDSGPGSLRDAVAYANSNPGADTITFAPSLNGLPITLTGGQLEINAYGGPLMINGNGSSNTIIQACDATANPSCTGASRIFQVDDNAALTLDGVTLRNGNAGIGRDGGGAIQVGLKLPWEGSSGRARLNVMNSSLVNNTAGDGGAINITSADVILDHTVVAGNNATGSGAGIQNTMGTLILTSSTLADNHAASGSGGGIFNNSGSQVADVTISNSTISGNTAGGVGGGFYDDGYENQGTFRITNSTFSGNTATGQGGAMYDGNGNVDLASVTIAGNKASDGGAIFTGLSSNYSTAAPVTLKNTIIADSTGGNCGSGNGTIISEGYNLSDDGSCGLTGTGDLNGVAARLAPLADNGGPTKTQALYTDSPAVDAGNPDGCTNLSGIIAPENDQRGPGYPRLVGTRCDIGAFEGSIPAPDSTAPVLTTPGDLTVEATSPSGAVATFTVTATDPDDAAGPVSCDPPSGATFALGTTTVNCTSTDTHGNTGSASFTVSVVDTIAPTVVCEPPDATIWYSDNVTVPCTASDSGSGLKDASDASFPLATNVSNGTETSTGATDSRTVCDNAANCTTVGPHTFMVDRKAPSIAIVSPTGGYILNQPVASNFSCTDGGSGVASCEGPATVDTSAVGNETFTVSAADNVGNTSSSSVQYAVSYKPQQTAMVNGARTLIVGLQLWDYNTVNVSASTITVTAARIVDASGSTAMTLSSPFTFTTKGPAGFNGGSYGYSVSVRSLPSGTYRLEYVAGNDPITHEVSFTR